MTDTTEISPNRGHRAASRAKTSEHVLASARKLFAAEGGYKSATIRAIAKDAGVSTGAISGAFGSKDDLYKAAHGHDPITPEQGVRLLAMLREVAERPVLSYSTRSDVEQLVAEFGPKPQVAE